MHGELIIPCNTCDKHFTTDYKRKLHEKTVHGDLIHVCEQCEKLFTTEYKRKLREKFVHGDLIHACEQCETRFSTLTRFKDHIKNHENPNYSTRSANSNKTC